MPVRSTDERLSTSQLGNQNTASESLFEQYLNSQGYTEWTHEEPVEGKPTTPDYRLKHRDTDFFFEVKEFDGPAPLKEAGSFDLYGPLRKKIVKAARQFKHYRDHSCSLVLANPKGAFVFPGKPVAVLGAMFGNLGIQISVGPAAPPDAHGKQVFLDGGKMRNRKSRSLQNTTISAIVSLTHYPVHEKRLEIRLNERAAELGRSLSADELMVLLDSVPPVEPTSVLRVIVFENPDARIQLHPDLFRGPFDERWGRVGNYMGKVFAGMDLTQIETELAEAKKDSPL